MANRLNLTIPLTAIAVIVVALVLIFTLSGDPDDPDQIVAGGATTPATSTAPAPGKDVGATFVEKIPKLLELARRGDLLAIDRLTDAWSACDGAPRSKAEAYTEAEAAAKALGLDKPDREPGVRRFEECLPFRTALRETGEREIVLLAAEAKRPYARERYLRTEREYMKREMTLPEERATYRERAQRYMREMIDEKNPRGLYETAFSYAYGTAFDRDAVRATAYFGAYTDVAGADAVRRRELDKVMTDLDVDQRAEAQRIRQEVTAAFCGDGGCKPAAGARPGAAR